jgi:hypothetical protein
MSSRRSNGPPPTRRYPSVSEWEHARVVPVDLGEFTVDLELPDLFVFALTDKGFPNPLRSVAELTKALQAESEEEEDLRNLLELQTYVIARQLRKPNLLEELGSIEAAQQWVIDKMVPEHRKKLWEYCVYHRPAAEVMEEARSVAALLPFPDERADVAPVDGGEPDGAVAQ